MRKAFENLTRAMVASDVDAIVLTPGADLFYLTGFEHAHAGERLLALVLDRDGSARWMAPRMNVPQVADYARAGEAVEGWTDAEGYAGALRNALRGAKSIAFDDEARAAFLMDLLRVAPGARLRPASELLRQLRIRKSLDEINALRVEAQNADSAIGEAVALCRPGATEQQIDRDLRDALLTRHGADSIAFTIIASGPNAALPHHETAGRALKAGDIVILDYGTQGSLLTDPADPTRRSRQFGYRSDITVTCSVGFAADADAPRVYQIVWEAQQAAIEAVRPGATCESIDRAARGVIERAGYGPQFSHRTGHGLGLQGHEPPYLVGGNTMPLEEGMVFSIEPGIYLEGRFGVRLEIIVAVTRDGVELLNAPSAPRLLMAPQ